MSGESSLVVKGTLYPPVPALKAGHLVPTANILVRECLLVLYCTIIFLYYVHIFHVSDSITSIGSCFFSIIEIA